MIGVLLLSIIISFVVWTAISSRKKLQLFKEVNVKHFPPNVFFGNAVKVLLGWMHQTEKLDELYHAFPEEEVIGYYDMMSPQLVIRCSELANALLVKNFSNFHDRHWSLKEGKIEKPEDANLFALSGNTWRAVRHKFSPLFTSGKLKFMYHSIADCGRTLVSVLEEKQEKDFEITDVMQMFATDVIGSTAFGIEANVLRNPNSQFRILAKKVFAGSFLANIKTAIFMFFPKIAKTFNIKAFSSQKINEYFFEILRNTLRERSENGKQRNDFVQMLLQLKQKGKIEVQIHDSGDDYLFQDNASDTFELEITDSLLLGGAFTFFIAGFHATAMAMSYTLFELSQHPEVEAKLRQEIASMVQGEDPTYEELRKMTYLESVIKESMRLHPAAPLIRRVCTKDYTTPRGFQMKQGQHVLIPVLSIHTDPAYWPDPFVFNPDRFQGTPPKPGTYFAFGDGPRICIAMRFAMLEVKFAIVKLLKNYKIQLSNKTRLPLKLNPRIFLTTPRNGIYLRVSKIK